MNIQKYTFIVALLLLTGCFYHKNQSESKTGYNSISEFIVRIESLPLNIRSVIVENEMAVIQQRFTSPEISDGEALFFFYNINVETVHLIGDLNQWTGAGFKMNKITGTSLFYITKSIVPNARFKYRYRLQDGTETTYPLNPLKDKSVFGEDSICEMDKYYYPETHYDENIAHGKLIELNLDNTTIFGSSDQKRKIQIYLPPNYYGESRHYKTMYFCDGSQYVEISKIPNVLDHMISKGEVEDMVAVFVDWLERDREYIEDTKSEYLSFLIDELIPLLENQYSLLQDREGRIAVGPSNGGHFVTYLGAFASDHFKYIFNQSGYPYFEANGMGGFGKRYLTENLPIKVFSQVGTYERPSTIQNMEKFHEYLRKNPTILGEKLVHYPQGHTYRLWGDGFREGILWLLK